MTWNSRVTGGALTQSATCGAGKRRLERSQDRSRRPVKSEPTRAHAVTRARVPDETATGRGMASKSWGSRRAGAGCDPGSAPPRPARVPKDGMGWESDRNAVASEGGDVVSTRCLIF